MSQFPGDKGSEFLAGTLGGPGYGEFPLGSAGPRVITSWKDPAIDTSDPTFTGTMTAVTVNVSGTLTAGTITGGTF